MSGVMSQRLRLAVALLLSGVLSGIAGMLPTLLLHTIHHLIQRLAYGYSVDPIIREDSFLPGVAAPVPAQRLTHWWSGGWIGLYSGAVSLTVLP